MSNPTTHPRLTADEARKLFHYDPETGVITRKTGRRAGHVTGKPTPSRGNYCFIKHGKTTISAHRLAWLLHTGEWPPHQIDHINNNPADNRLCNLRPATVSENLRNRPRFRNNKLGVKGVCKVGNRYRAQCWRDGRFVLNKHFATVEEAALAYRTTCLDEFGIFARPE